MESQFLSPIGVPPHLRSEGIYRVHTSVYNFTYEKKKNPIQGEPILLET